MVSLLGLQTAPILYDGLWEERKIHELYQPVLDGDACEGYVVRLAAAQQPRRVQPLAGEVDVGGRDAAGAHLASRGVLLRLGDCPALVIVTSALPR